MNKKTNNKHRRSKRTTTKTGITNQNQNETSKINWQNKKQKITNQNKKTKAKTEKQQREQGNKNKITQ